MTPPESNRTRPGRPFPLILVFCVLFFWSLLSWLRFADALTERALLLEFLTPGLYGYILGVGLLGGLAALPALWGLIRGAPWTPTAFWIAAIYYPGLYWFERLFLWADPNAQGDQLFMLLFTLLWFGSAAWVLLLKRSRRFFRRDDETED